MVIKRKAFSEKFESAFEKALKEKNERENFERERILKEKLVSPERLLGLLLPVKKMSLQLTKPLEKHLKLRKKII